MSKIIKRSIAILLCVTALILLLIPAGKVEASIERGAFTLDGSTLEKYNGMEPNVTIPIGVNRIGKEAFANNNYIQSVYIPDGVTSIDFSAFENCKNLEKVVIGNDLRKIGQSVFSGCQSLREINIPRYVEEIGSGALAACPSLSSVTIDANNRHFICLDGVIYTKDGKKMVQYLAGRPYSTYTIPSPVTEIGEFGFYGANMLTGVDIIEGVKEIPEYTFLNCNALNNVTIPRTVESIRQGAFGGCPNLTKLAIPAEVRYIDPKAFTSLTGETGYMMDTNTGTVLSEASETQNTSQQLDNSNNSEQLIPEGTNFTDISEFTSSNNDNNDTSDDTNEENLLDNLVNKIKESANQNDPSALGTTKIVGGQAVFMMDPKSFTVKSFNIEEAQTEDSIADSVNQTPDGNTVRDFSGNEFDIINGVLGNYGSNNSDVSIPDSVSKIGNRVFYKNRDIKNVSMPNTVNEIGDFSFARSSVESVNLPENINKIGYAAFLNCKNLADINIPNTVDTIELGAFEGTKYLDNFNEIEDGNDFLIVGNGILIDYKGFGGDVVIPDGVKKIGPGVFEGLTSLNSVSIPNSVTDICEDAFNGCTKLSNIVLPSYVKNIEDRAFKDTNLSSVSIPASVENIGMGAFDTTSTNGGMNYVSFSSTTLPDVSYKPTASRLSAYNLRTKAFEGTQNAFVIEKANLKSGNIFDAHEYGFNGIVYTDKGKNENGENLLEVRKVTKYPDENGNVMINGSVDINNVKYVLSGVRDSAFDEYQNTDWCNKDVSSIFINGNNSSDVSKLTSNVPIFNPERKALTINLDPALNYSENDINATIPGNTDRFILNIANNSSDNNLFLAAFNNRYGHSENVELQSLSIDMMDKLGAIPIHKMADNKMDITLPVPENMKNISDLKVASLDDNGLLENIPSEILYDADGLNDKIKFVAGHLSPYCIYYFTDVSSLIMEGELMAQKETIESQNTLGVPLTQDIFIKTLTKKVGFIPARYIIALLFFVIAGFLFYLTSKKYTIKIIKKN